MSNLYVNTIYPRSQQLLGISGSLHAQSASIGGFLQTMGVGNAATISSLTSVPEDYHSLLFGPITVTDSLIISGTVKIKDLEDF